MFDGQNLFDAKTSFIGKEWQIDETIEENILKMDIISYRCRKLIILAIETMN